MENEGDNPWLRELLSSMLRTVQRALASAELSVWYCIGSVGNKTSARSWPWQQPVNTGHPCSVVAGLFAQVMLYATNAGGGEGEPVCVHIPGVILQKQWSLWCLFLNVVCTLATLNSWPENVYQVNLFCAVVIIFVRMVAGQNLKAETRQSAMNNGRISSSSMVRKFTHKNSFMCVIVVRVWYTQTHIRAPSR
jgi:hypothetical protein